MVSRARKRKTQGPHPENQRQPAKHEHDLRHGKHAQFAVILVEAVGAQERHAGVGGGETDGLGSRERLLDELLEIDLVTLARQHLDVGRRALHDLAQREVELAHRRRGHGAWRAIDAADATLQRQGTTHTTRQVKA